MISCFSLNSQFAQVTQKKNKVSWIKYEKKIIKPIKMNAVSFVLFIRFLLISHNNHKRK